MNDLVGAFLLAQEKNEDLVKTRQSLANAGYSIPEIEEALIEAKQGINKRTSNSTKEARPKKKKNLLLVLFLIVFLLAISGLLVYFFWDRISPLLNLTEGS